MDAVEGPDEAAAATADPNLVIDEDEDLALPVQAHRLEDGSIELRLRFPIVLRIRNGATNEIREDRTESIVFHRLTGEHLLAAQSSGGQFMRTLMAKSARVSDAKMAGLLRAMDASDAFAATMVVQVFTGSGQTTGR